MSHVPYVKNLIVLVILATTLLASAFSLSFPVNEVFADSRIFVFQDHFTDGKISDMWGETTSSGISIVEEQGMLKIAGSSSSPLAAGQVELSELLRASPSANAYARAQIKLGSVAQDSGSTARIALVQDSDNFIVFGMVDPSGVYYQRKQGADTLTQTILGIPRDTHFHNYRIQYDGSEAKLFFDAELVASVEIDLSTFEVWLQSHTYHLGPGAVVAKFDRFHVTAPTAGLVAHWKFDEGFGTKTTDSSGNANTGTLVNGPSWLDSENCAINPGGTGSCLGFDGVNDYVRVARSSSIEPSNAITIAMWVNADVPRGALIDKAAEDHTDPFYSYNLQLEPKTGQPSKAELIWSVTTHGVWTFIGEGPSEVLINLNTWQFVTVVYDGSRMKEYVNGELKASIAKTGTITYFETSLQIGKYLNHPFHTNADIDDVRIYNRALSASEIKQIYQETKQNS